MQQMPIIQEKFCWLVDRLGEFYKHIYIVATETIKKNAEFCCQYCACCWYSVQGKNYMCTL